MKRHLYLAVLVLAPLAGCEYFSTVVIPASDTTDPLPWSSVYFDGDHQAFSGGASSTNPNYLTVTMTDINKLFWAIGAITDQGGARGVQIAWREWVLCGSVFGGPPTYPWKNVWYGDAQALDSEQPTGTSVSSGAWTGYFLRMSDIDPGGACGILQQPVGLAVTWAVDGVDYKGNTAQHVPYFGPSGYQYYPFESPTVVYWID